jgi:CheY-like chemotaxis protein
MTRLVDDLLDLSRISQGRPRVEKTRLDLRKVAERAVEMTRALIEGRRHRLTIDLPPQPLGVDGDDVRLVQVVSNLLANASSYTDAGGHIELRVSEEDGVATVRVRDNGRGLSADMLDRVFDMFLRNDRSSSGLGIGLTLARRVALLHGGSLVAYSEGEGKGSEFVLRLPLAEAPVAEGDARDEAPHPHLRVLLVEDQADQGRALALVMEHRGHEVRLADSGHMALAEARSFQPDVVLLDLDLPDMDGCEVARRLRAGGARAPLVALSGFGLESDRQRTQAAGCVAHLTKPVTPQQLEQVFRSVRPS